MKPPRLTAHRLRPTVHRLRLTEVQLAQPPFIDRHFTCRAEDPPTPAAVRAPRLTDSRRPAPGPAVPPATQLADVLHLAVTGGLRAAASAAERLLADHPGCAVAAVATADGTVLLHPRAGSPLLARLADPPRPWAAALLLGSLTHARLAAGHRWRPDHPVEVIARPGPGHCLALSWSGPPGPPGSALILPSSRTESGAPTDR
ncbi:hypothetical protein [Kitasatospora sp. MMS16-BH015]|uniref:hypothetical protein n=1 Tax=Kitasatospora sp. MMS16-BH015 TaxID=2018025 RepID=UPI000CF24F6A|nr:hypothetical protein [Kitasatospora sp. MMS16-BH015]